MTPATHSAEPPSPSPHGDEQRAAAQMGTADAACVSTLPGGGRLFGTPGGIVLGDFGSVADGRARSFVIQMKAGRFHGFVVRRGNIMHGWVDRCPHAGLPLARILDQYLTPDGRHVVCSWHGAMFEPTDGTCVGGPCAGQKLTDWPVEVHDGQIITSGKVATTCG